MGCFGVNTMCECERPIMTLRPEAPQTAYDCNMRFMATVHAAKGAGEIRPSLDERAAARFLQSIVIRWVCAFTAKRRTEARSIA